MHGWGYTETQYKTAFPALLSSVRSLTGKGGRLIWANTTPVKPNAFNGATNPRIEERNAIAQEQVRAAGISIDDQHTLMTEHPDLHEDAVHFGPRGADIMGDHVAASIRAAMRR
jgi:lysophospholipase L1-like esterase